MNEREMLENRKRMAERRRLNRLAKEAEREATNLLNKLTGANTPQEKRDLIRASNPLFYSLGTKFEPQRTEYEDD